jgi:hypothetical protein
VPCTECVGIAAQAQTLCESRGGSDEQCLAEAEQILSECALTCEGTPEETTDACSSAADAKNQVCIDAGGELVVCQAEADDFFEACFGAPLPVCGNDLLEVGEECDGSNLNGMTCFDRGFDGGGELSCDSTCDFDTSLCEIE